MKTIKIIPVLAVAMLLSACDFGGGVKVSAPKFAKYSASIELNDLRKEFKTEKMEPGPAIADLEYYKEDATVTSKELKTKISLVTASKEVLDKKTLSSSESKQVIEAVSQLDVTNKVGKTKSVTKTELKTSDLYGKSSGSGKSESIAWMQEGTAKKDDKDVEGILGLDEKAKTYSLDQEFSEYFKKEGWEKYYVQMSGQQVVYGFESSIPSALIEEKELKKYSFFKDGSVYTIKYVHEDEKPEEFKNAKDEVYAEQTTKVERINQLEISGNKLIFRSSNEQTITKTYKLNYGDHQKGAVETSETKTYNEMSIYDSKASLKVQDLSKYVYLG